MNISQAEIVRNVLPEVAERVKAGTFDDEELYEALCVIVRMNSETRSDGECEEMADRVHDFIKARITD